MSDKNKTKLAYQFILKSRSDSLTLGPFITNDGREDKTAKVGTLTQSIRAFPSFHVTLQNESNHPVLVNLASGHQIIYEISRNDEPYLKQFAGEISKVVIESKGGKRGQIKIEAESPFVKLQYCLLDGKDIVNLGFRALIRYMMTKCGAWGIVNFDDDVPDDIAVIGAKGYPAFALLKQICFQRDLIFDIKAGDDMRISRRLTREAEMLKNIPTLNSKDIISMKITR